MIRFKDFSFCYEGSTENTLTDIDLEIEDGSVVLLTGRSGCGKSTILRSINGLIPHFYPGKTYGDVLFNGMSLLEMKPSEISGKVGTVFQDPRSQFFMTDTTRELAFGCENMGYEREEIITRIEKAVTDLELEDFLNRSIFSLSSGEKQQIAIGSVYAMMPGVFVFDEPSANLDHEATRRLRIIIQRLKNNGNTVIVADHRFFYLRDLIDTAVIIEDGQIAAKYTGSEFCALDRNYRIQKGLRTVYPEKEVLKAHVMQPERQSGNKGNTFTTDSLSFSYEKNNALISNLSFESLSGDVIGIIGHNGAGKTTLISVLTGLLKERSGRIFYNGKRVSAAKRRKLSYLVMQDADYQLFTASVEEELTLGTYKTETKLVDDILDRLALSEYKDKHPASLSGGQKQRVTIGASLIKNSEILYFDEPTSGLDYDSMIRVSSLIKELSARGTIIFLISHDFEFISHTCTKILDLDTDHGNQMQELNEETLQRLAEKFL